MKILLIRISLCFLLLPIALYAQWQRIAGQDVYDPQSVVVKGGKVFVGTGQGVFRSTNDGRTWTPASVGINLTFPVKLLTFGPTAGSDTSLIAITALNDWEGSAAYLSTNDGASWTDITNGLPKSRYDTTKYGAINCMLAVSTDQEASLLFSGTSQGAWVSTNMGTTWTSANKGLGHDTTNFVEVCALAAGRNSAGAQVLFAATSYDGVFRSTNGDLRWTPAGLNTINVTSLIATPGSAGPILLAGTDHNGVFTSSDQGNNWAPSNNDFPRNPYDTSFYAQVNALGAGPGASNAWNLYAATMYGLARSTDEGKSWTRIGNSDVVAMAIRGGEIFQVQRISIWRGWGHLGYLVHSTDCGSTSKTMLGTVYSHIASRVDSAGVPRILVGTGTWVGWGGEAVQEGILGSTDMGGVWNPLNDGFPKALNRPSEYAFVGEIASDGETGGNVFAATDAGLYLSTNGGSSWIADTVGLSGASPTCFAFIPQSGGTTTTIAGTYFDLLLSREAGTGWVSTRSGLPLNPGVNALAVVSGSGDTAVVAATSSGVYRSTNTGVSWENIDPNHTHLYGLAISRSRNGKANILARSWDGIMRSTDGGRSWIESNAGLTDRSVVLLRGHEGTVDNPAPFALAGTGSGIALSLNGGASWNAVNEGLPPSTEITDLAFCGNDVVLIVTSYLYGYYDDTFITEIYRRPIANLLASVPDTIVMSSPKGGEIWYVGSSRPIRWSAALEDSVNIDYSTNNGSTWESIARGLPASFRIYPWTIPNVPSSTCKIRVSDAMSATDTEISPGTFTIAHDSLADMFGRVADTSIASTVRALEAFGPRMAFDLNRDTVAPWIAARFATLGVTNVASDTFLINGSVQKNVIATIQGRVGTSEEIIVGAHYDSNGGPGADDNASGTAAVLEMARVIVQSGYKPQATLRFITFGAEEFGMIGSANYASKARAAGQNIVLMQNYDMIGYYNPNRINRDVYVVWYPGAEAEASLDSALKCKYTSLTPVVTTAYNSRSDSWSFYENGYKAVFNIEAELNPRYHSPEDSTVYMDFMYATEIVKSGLALLLTIDQKIVTSASNEKLPATWSLQQNYPNPFNPTTVISYQLPAASYVSLKIFDLLGREVADLVNEIRSAGSYTVQWNAGNMPSGVYFYRLQARQTDGGQAGDFVQTRKVVLLK